MRKRKRILMLHNSRCHFCGEEIDPDSPWDIHHLVPLARGGPRHAKSNLVPVHRACHRAHHLKENRAKAKYFRWLWILVNQAQKDGIDALKARKKIESETDMMVYVEIDIGGKHGNDH